MLRAALPALLLLPAPALALTPAELWQAWQDQAASWGASLSGTATPGPGGSLALGSLALGLPGETPEPLPPEFALTLRPEADGAVLIDLGLAPLTVLPPADASAPEVALGQRGLAIRATGAPGALSYAIAAERLALGVFQPPSDWDGGSSLAIEVDGFAARLPGQLDPQGRGEMRLSTEGYRMVESAPALFGGAATTASELAGRTGLSAAWTIPPGLDPAELAESPIAWARALEAGLALSIAAESGALTTRTSARGWPFAYDLVQEAAPSVGTFSFDRSGIAAAGGYAGGAVSLTLPEAGLGPFAGRVGDIAAEIRLPFSATPAPARYALSIGDSTLDDAAWDALDPGRHLPRGPFRFELDLGARLALDLPSLLAAAEAGEDPPIPQLESASLDALDIALAGMRLTGSGSFTVQGTGEDQRPVGRAELRLDGLDALLDGLVAAGWIEAADARDLRFGVAAAFRAGPDPDSRVLSFEAQGAAGMTLNGTPLPMP